MTPKQQPWKVLTQDGWWLPRRHRRRPSSFTLSQPRYSRVSPDFRQLDKSCIQTAGIPDEGPGTLPSPLLLTENVHLSNDFAWRIVLYSVLSSDGRRTVQSPQPPVSYFSRLKGLQLYPTLHLNCSIPASSFLPAWLALCYLNNKNAFHLLPLPSTGKFLEKI